MNLALLSIPALVLPAPQDRTEPPTFLFTIDWKGPTISVPNSGSGVPIIEGDVLSYGPGAPGFGTLPPPSTVISGDQLGLARYGICLGHPPGTPCGVEVDAISQGLDPVLLEGALPGGLRLWFSVDEWAVGDPSLSPAPTVLSEGGPVGDCAADLFVEYGLGSGPLPPSAGPGSHVGTLDGNGLPSATPQGNVYPGVGLIEPTLPGVGPPNVGDNLDSADLGGIFGFPPGGMYMSLDSAFIDPATGIANSGTAAFQGFSGADLLRVPAPGATPILYASANQLGLDLAGVDTDDIDALILAENGDGVYQPSQAPYDWASGATDMLLFSVRRGSAVIGMPDSIFGIAIEEGDILTAPVAGGASQFPGIFYAAEVLGLATNRTTGVDRADDVDALDIITDPYFDCNHNGVEDSVDIATGASSDNNNNGIPDECEAISEYCYCPPGSSPCGNPDPNAGCANSTGQGGHLYFTGTHSVSADDLVLVSDQLPPNQFGLFFMGGGQNQLLFGDGLRCAVGGGFGLFRYGVKNTGGLGKATLGPGIVAYSCANFPPAGCITAGSTWYYQFWHRDPPGPCGSGWNTSNAVAVSFGP